MQALLSTAPSSSSSPALLVGDKGRKHYTPRRATPPEWRPQCAPIPQPDRTDRPTGKKVTSVPSLPEVPVAQRVHYDHSNAKSSAECEFGMGLKMVRKIRPVDPSTGIPRACLTSSEAALSDVMGRKRRVDPNDLTAIRNGFGVAKLGDKLYASPEYAPGFFKEGAAVPGASFGMFKPLPEFKSSSAAAATAAAASDTSLLSTKVYSGTKKAADAVALPPKLTLEQRRLARLLQDEVNDVKGLSPAGEPGVSWEEKMGLLTV